MMLTTLTSIATAIIAISTLLSTANAQWTHRYPLLTGYAHHLYVELENLPIASAGLTDPVVCNAVAAVSYRGWIWQLNLETLRLERLSRQLDQQSMACLHGALIAPNLRSFG